MVEAYYYNKYDAHGRKLWTQQFGSSSDEFAVGIAADGRGVYVTGATAGSLKGQISSGHLDAFLSKYDVNGRELWIRQFGTPQADGANDVVTDENGIYVVGSTHGTFPWQTSSGGQDTFVRMYGVNGDELWTRQYDPSRVGMAKSIAVNHSGQYIVSVSQGISTGHGKSESSFIARLINDGGSTPPALTPFIYSVFASNNYRNEGAKSGNLVNNIFHRGPESKQNA